MGNPQSWLEHFNQLSREAEKESAAAKGSEDLKEPGDYLWAEAIGNSAEEWKALFVPEFLAAQELLSKNITVLTGARGCGKTMAFRRLTVFMDKVIGQPSGVRGADTFVGFYLNCRDLVEAFPWLPADADRAHAKADYSLFPSFVDARNLQNPRDYVTLRIEKIING